MATTAASPILEQRSRGASHSLPSEGVPVKLPASGEEQIADARIKSPEETFEDLKAEGAIQEGHFKYESGRHGAYYVEKFRILEKPKRTEELCRQLAAHFRELEPEIVVGPTTGGIILAHETAKELGDSVKAFFAEPKKGGGRFLGRGFEVTSGQRVLVVDDVLTTGGSIRDTMDAVQERGGTIVGIGVLVDRTNGRVEFDGLKSYACLSIDIASYDPDPKDCKLCATGVKLTET